MARIIPAFTLEARIKRDFRAHLKKLGIDQGGFSPAACDSKQQIRTLHSDQRKRKARDNASFVRNEFPKLKRYLADGVQVRPSEISPRVEVVSSGTWQASLFRLATLTWSVPVSEGYGRRMRFLVWDDSIDKLIGVFALGDPVFNLRVRDSAIGWSGFQRRHSLVNIMDAYVLGAVPPYNYLLAGKLIACLTNCLEVQDAFERKYANRTGVISGEVKSARLMAITTSSALGRSSLYNRLTLNGRRYFKSIGYTSGWGHFHLPDSIFNMMRIYLQEEGHAYGLGHEFGSGPNWRLRTIRAALELLDLDTGVLNHGIGREVFISELATNAFRVLRGEVKQLRGRFRSSAADIGSSAIDRWISSRALRNPAYLSWTASDFRQLATVQPQSSMVRTAIRRVRRSD